MTAQQVLTALAAIRSPQTQDEYDLHGLVASALQQADIAFRHEAPLAPRCRIDFLCDTVGIEIKRGRPDKTPVEKQLRRYAETGKVKALILVSEKTRQTPSFVAGVPVYPVSLYKLWGIATGGGREPDSLPTENERKEAASPTASMVPLSQNAYHFYYTTFLQFGQEVRQTCIFSPDMVKYKWGGVPECTRRRKNYV